MTAETTGLPMEDQVALDVAAGKDVSLTVWEDRRSGDGDIYGMRTDASGVRWRARPS
ncbi:MAG: hypothetical protein ACRDKZ_04090 [Actinomycetota bacterium]